MHQNVCCALSVLPEYSATIFFWYHHHEAPSHNKVYQIYGGRAIRVHVDRGIEKGKWRLICWIVSSLHSHMALAWHFVRSLPIIRHLDWGFFRLNWINAILLYAWGIHLASEPSDLSIQASQFARLGSYRNPVLQSKNVSSVRGPLWVPGHLTTLDASWRLVSLTICFLVTARWSLFYQLYKSGCCNDDSKPDRHNLPWSWARWTLQNMLTCIWWLQQTFWTVTKLEAWQTSGVAIPAILENV